MMQVERAGNAVANSLPGSIATHIEAPSILSTVREKAPVFISPGILHPTAYPEGQRLHCIWFGPSL